MDYDSYLPVDPDYYDIINNLAESNSMFRVIYFLPDQTLGEVKGDKYNSYAYACLSCRAGYDE